jgi:hypothetical protein
MQFYQLGVHWLVVSDKIQHLEKKYHKREKVQGIVYHIGPAHLSVTCIIKTADR